MPSKHPRPTFSVSRAFYERLSSYCAERGVSMSALCERVVNDAMGVPYVERIAHRDLKPDNMPDPSSRPLTPRAAVYTCSVCGAVGHNAASHAEDYAIDVSPELYELISDLRVRARELDGVELTRGEILERGIERVLVAQNHQHERDRA